MISDKVIAEIKERGIAVELVEQQIRNFKNGFPYLKIVKAAAVEDGVLRLNKEGIDKQQQYYIANSKDKKIVKFVPASGAASRMFKDLFSFVDTNEKNESVKTFIYGLEGFAFFKMLKTNLANKGIDINGADHAAIVKELLLDDSMEYGSLPKGLLLFHLYGEVARTPVEEHLVEGAGYAVGQGGQVNIHFTVSPNHEGKFKNHINNIKQKYEQELGVKFNIEFSNQKNTTDTIAVDMENNPFKENDGTVLFRPAGHGALLDNLNEIDSDIIFIKNIDNVVPDRLKKDTVVYKQVLGGVLLNLQKKAFSFLDKLDEDIDSGLIKGIEIFLKEDLFIEVPTSYHGKTDADKASYLKSKLDRPIRVCGMVKNEGAAGGGPFWVENSDGSSALQILETAQINLDDPSQFAILEGASHFNPVDLLCGVKDRHGKKYDLLKFRDSETGFISFKSKNGQELKAQELPGLWNGAMSDWNTVFVEVPIVTFNPVKSVVDLLKKEHRA